MKSVRVRRRGSDELSLAVARDDHAALDRLRHLVGRGALRREGPVLTLSLSGAEPLLAVDQSDTIDWDAGARQAVINRALARRNWLEVRGLLEALRSGGSAEARTRLADVTDLDRLDGHQLIDVALMAFPATFGACIFDEQGTGKTVVVIHAFDALVARGLADLLIVVAPKSMVPEWGADFARFKGDLYRVVSVTGDSGNRPLAQRGTAEVVVANFESVVAMEAEFVALAKSCGGRAVLVVDESYNVKNPAARRTGSIARLREWCGRSFVLCGTPAPNSAADIVSQFDLVDFGMTFRGVVIPDDREAARPIIQGAMESKGIYLRSLKADVLPSLPTKAFARVIVPFEPKQRQAYEAALDDLIIDVTATDPATFARASRSFLARRSALLQICSYPAGVVPDYAEVPGKLVALDRILDAEVARRGEKVVVWSFYRGAIETIVKRYSHLGVVRYDGSVEKVADRRDAVRRFQEDDSTMVFVGNPAAAGAGLTLHRARLAVYESISPQAAHFLQSVDRIHRRGQERDVELIALLCEDSIEIPEFDRLLGKAASQRELLRDTDNPVPSREALLSELLEARRLLAGHVAAD